MWREMERGKNIAQSSVRSCRRLNTRSEVRREECGGGVLCRSVELRGIGEQGQILD